MTENKPKKEPYIYRCKKHDYELESYSPPMKGSLKVFCPLCKDEFLAKHLEELENENPRAGKWSQSQ
tara:strand:- start:2059 stop:2259 length:201 start_codon:yes stop_codon:yes gene_type:complete